MSTKLLNCSPTAITFTADQPQISDPETLISLQTAANHLSQHLKTVVIPTETVYGLAASALHSKAVADIFAIKGRPPDNPLIVHISSLQMLNTLLPIDFTLPITYQALIKHFWPGPLTLLLPANAAVIPPIVTANLPTVAVRMPSHPVARALIAISGTPLAAPSANSSGIPSPTRPEHVLRDLGGKVDLVLDGGPCAVGVESTVIDGLQPDGNIRILRPGGLTVENVERVLSAELGDQAPQVLVYGRDFREARTEQVPTTPGMKYRHYSPSVPVTLLYTLSSPPNRTQAVQLRDFLRTLLDTSPKLDAPLKVGLLAPTDSPFGKQPLPTEGFQWQRAPLGSISNKTQMAHDLFDGLLALEQAGVDLILVEEVEPRQEGLAVMNRLQKAASSSVYISSL